MRRVEKSHQPTLEIAAAHEELLCRPLRGLVIDRQRAPLENQMPRRPEHREVGGEDDVRRDDVPVENDGIPDRKAAETAIASFNKALQADAQYLPALEAIAKLYLRTGDLPKAALWSRRILTVDPNHAAARQALAAY